MFGHALAKDFMHEPGHLAINHGASGSVCKPAFDAQIKSLKSKAAFPDKHYYPLRSLGNLRLEERSAIAKVLDADAKDLIVCQGATTAMNAVLRSFEWNKGDKILVMSTIFHNCQHTLEFVAQQFGIQLIPLHLQYPLSDADLLAQFSNCLEEHKPRMALFDTVSSTPSVYFPWEDMCAACNAHQVLSLVDAAHGIGLVPISLRTAKPTFLFTNIHKWFWVSQSAGALYVDPEFQAGIQSLPIAMVSPLAEGDQFARKFGYSSTLDYTVLDSIPAAAAFRESLGGEKEILKYQTELAAKVAEYVCQEWKTTEVNPLARRQAMVTIKTPLQPKDPKFPKFVLDRLREKHNLILPVFPYEGEVWVRFCAAAYNELVDFKKGMAALEECFAAYTRELAQD